MRIAILFCSLFSLWITGHSAKSAGTAQELSSTDISLLWAQCNNVTTEVRTVVADPKRVYKPLLFNNHPDSLKSCHERLNSNTFLWVEANFMSVILYQNSKTHIFIRRITDKMLNMNNQMHSNPLLDAKEFVILEINHKNLKSTVNIITEELHKIEKKTHIKYYKYKITPKGTKLVDHRRICLDFGGYSKLQATGEINIKDLKTSLCYLSREMISLPQKYLKSFGKRVFGQKETVIFKAKVEIKMQTINGNKPDPVTLSALAIVDRLAVETIRIKT